MLRETTKKEIWKNDTVVCLINKQWEQITAVLHLNKHLYLDLQPVVN